MFSQARLGILLVSEDEAGAKFISQRYSLVVGLCQRRLHGWFAIFVDFYVGEVHADHTISWAIPRLLVDFEAAILSRSISIQRRRVLHTFHLLAGTLSCYAIYICCRQPEKLWSKLPLVHRHFVFARGHGRR